MHSILLDICNSLRTVESTSVVVNLNGNVRICAFRTEYKTLSLPYLTCTFCVRAE